MAIFTAFMGALRPGSPGSPDGVEYYYPVMADVVVMDSTGTALSYADQGTAWTGLVTLVSNDGLAPSDTLASARAKVMAVLRPQYPQIKATDQVKAVWLDNGGLLSL